LTNLFRKTKAQDKNEISPHYCQNAHAAKEVLGFAIMKNYIRQSKPFFC
jgi:hypothetical protein